jgi:hypothetical protein
MKIIIQLSFIVCLSTFAATSKAQNPTSLKGKKGNLYMYWGWNQARFSASDLHFKGNNYDFTLQNVLARDRQTPFDARIYFGLETITIPQVNYKIGYYVSDKYDISFGIDHMKYVMTQYQTVKINGVINNSDSRFDGTYDNKDIVLTEDFLTFEHTDGLNYLNFEVNRYDKITDLSKIKLKGIEINLTEGISAGALMPKTNTQLLKNNRYDAYHFAGYGVGLKVGLNVTFGRHFFIQSDLKGGFINMPDIRTTASESDKAAQHFFFLQSNILFGFQFKIKRYTK